MSLSGQVKDSINDSKNYIYKFSGEVLYCDKIEFKKPQFSGDYMEIDGIKHNKSEVKFYNSNNGFFANRKYLTSSHYVSFCKRIEKGNVNIYSKESFFYKSVLSTNSGVKVYFGNEFADLGTKTDYYYNKGFGNLQKINFRNLNNDLSANPKSLLQLQKYTSIKKRQNIFYIVGTALITAGFLKMKNVFEPNSNPNESSRDSVAALAISGILVNSITYGLGRKDKKDCLKNAIDAYNE